MQTLPEVDLSGFFEKKKTETETFDSPESLLEFMEMHQDSFRYNGRNWIFVDMNGRLPEDDSDMSPRNCGNFVTVELECDDNEKFTICLNGWFFIESLNDCMTEDDEKGTLSRMISIPTTSRKFMSSCKKILDETIKRASQIESALSDDMDI